MASQSRVDIVFGKFVSLYGAQKVAAMWAGADIADIKADWERQLARFTGPAIGRALQCLVDSGDDWPPTLPKFAALCRDQMRPEAMPAERALPAPGGAYTANDEARKKIAALMDFMRTNGRVTSV